MRVFVQIFYGESIKWLRELPTRSINGIEVLEEFFMKKWGDVKDQLYYMMDFASLKRKSDESVTNFTNCFNKMYGKIPIEITSNISYANAFDATFSLLLRERRPITLINMQEATL